ncbi:MAG: hypothetical protein F6J96_34180 [Symploca sp. SIO1C2]|nr:hypothetical protein [Symploca sp. SIO1C2]
MREKKANRVSLRLGDEIYTELQTEALARGISISQVVTELIDQGLKLKQQSVDPNLLDLHKRMEAIEEIILNQTKKDSAA